MVRGEFLRGHCSFIGSGDQFLINIVSLGGHKIDHLQMLSRQGR